jgi:beta-lactamase class A
MMRVFDDINSGKLTWDTPMLDTTAGGCFERTIVPSTNPCAEEWIRQYGRQALNDYVHGKGFSGGTGFTFRDATHTTAGDLAKYLIGLNNGSLITGSNRDMLLEKMGRQLYRTGIPAGAKGWAQDKVGFLWDYIHDAAIVHNPRGNYVLVVMTKGYSYGYIANVARQIDTILYP